MRYQNVCIESLGYTLPEEILSSDEIERRLAPLYQRLRLLRLFVKLYKKRWFRFAHIS